MQGVTQRAPDAASTRPPIEIPSRAREPAERSAPEGGARRREAESQEEGAMSGTLLPMFPGALAQIRSQETGRPCVRSGYSFQLISIRCAGSEVEGVSPGLPFA